MAKTEESPVFLRAKKRFPYTLEAEKHNVEQAHIDDRVLSQDPWDPEEKQKRIQENRPVIAVDELSQYTNGLENSVMQTPIAIKITPTGVEATDKTALRNSEIIKGIEYDSNMPIVDVFAFGGAVQHGFGYAEITKEWVESDDPAEKFNKRLVVLPVPNSYAIHPDPDGVRLDGLDWKYLFKDKWYTEEEFTAEFPEAEQVDWDPSALSRDTVWFDYGPIKKIRVVIYWEANQSKVKDLLVVGQLTFGAPVALPKGKEGTSVSSDELPEGWELKGKTLIAPNKVVYPVAKIKPSWKKEVNQYVLNGIQILSEEGWEGPCIPFIPCYGKIKYRKIKDYVQKETLSMHRLARDGALCLDYAVTTCQELLGLISKAPWQAAAGTLVRRKDWESAHKAQVAILEYNPLYTDTKTGMQVQVAAPARAQYELAIQGIQAYSEELRRHIQASMGLSALPTSAQRQNEKSGVALKEIRQQFQAGSFNFIQNYQIYKRAIGQQLLWMLQYVYDTPQTVQGMTEADEPTTYRVNDPTYEDPKTKEKVFHDMSVTGHSVTVSTGPASDSERDESIEMANTLLTPQLIQQAFSTAPDKAQKFMGKVLRFRNMGPVAEQFIDIIDPPVDEDMKVPPAAQAQMQEAAKHIQMADQAVEELTQKVAELQRKEEGQVVQGDIKLKIAQIDAWVKIRTAEISAGASANAQQDQLQATSIEQIMEQSHKAAMAAQDQEHQLNMQAGDQQHAQEMGERGHEQSLESQEQAAELAPDPGGE